jgi:membrane protein
MVGLLWRSWNLFEKTITRWTRNDGNLLAASMAYYAAFSFFPLLWVLISVLGFALRFSSGAQAIEQELLKFLSQTTAPSLAQEVGSLLSGVRARAAYPGLLGPLIAVVAAIGIFSMLESAFDRLWHAVTPHERGVRAAIRNALWNRLKAFLTLLGLGLVVLAAFVAELIFTAIQTWAEEEELSWTSTLWPRLEWLFGFTLNAFVLSVVYKMIPRAKVRNLHALIGGVTVSVIWQVGSRVVSRLVVSGHYTAYGVVGSFIAMMLWVYCASILLFLGAQLVQVLGHPEENTIDNSPAAEPISAANAGTEPIAGKVVLPEVKGITIAGVETNGISESPAAKSAARMK